MRNNKFNYIIKVCILISFLFITKYTKSQIENKNLELKVEVKYVDSEYVMIPKLNVLSKDYSVKIHKELTFDSENNMTVDCRLYLQKQLQRCYVNLYLEAFRDPMISENIFKFRDFKYGDKLLDSVNLKYYYPLELGDYRIMIAFDYYINGEKHTISSEYVDFQIKSPPKNPLFY